MIFQAETAKKKEVEVIVIQGMADLPPIANSMIATMLGAKVYDPKWHDNSMGLDQRVTELGEYITSAREEGKQVVIVGISAGAGLAMVYLSQFPDDIRHIYSVGGVLNPDPKLRGGKFPDLLRDSRAFGEMTKHLHEWYQNSGVVENYNLRDKVTAYVSGREGGDGTLPESVLKPDWVSAQEVSDGDHIESIGKALLTEIRERVEELKEAKFE